jgi:hypothetical protein
LNPIDLSAIFIYSLIFFAVLIFFFVVLIFPSCGFQAVVILEEIQIFDLWFKTNGFETTFDSLENISARSRRESLSILHL